MPVTQKVTAELFTDAPPVAIYVDAVVFAANTAESFTVPAGARLAVFSCNQPAFYLRTTGTAAIPAADVSDGTASMLNPTYREVYAGDSISVIAPTDGILTIEYYSRQGA